MRHTIIPASQQVINKINARQGFTFPAPKNRYVVGIKTLHSSMNPSVKYKTIYGDVTRFIDELDEGNIMDQTIGGWLDGSNVYHVDLGTSYDSIVDAVRVAKEFNQEAIYDIKDGVELNVQDEYVKLFING